MYDLRCILLPGMLLIDGAYDTQGDASHGEEHSYDSLCSSVRKKKTVFHKKTKETYRHRIVPMI